MRISVDRHDPGYGSYMKHPDAMIYLDGVRLLDCHTADETLGYVVRIGPTYTLYKQYGVVEIVLARRRSYAVLGGPPA